MKLLRKAVFALPFPFMFRCDRLLFVEIVLRFANVLLCKALIRLWKTNAKEHQQNPYK